MNDHEPREWDAQDSYEALTDPLLPGEVQDPGVFDAPERQADDVRAMEAMGEAIDAIPEDEPMLVTEDEPLAMADWEAFSILKRISAVQAELADIEKNAAAMKQQAVSDLRDYLGSFDRLPRLSIWRSLNAGKGRKTVTTLAGAVGEKTVPARCVVADRGLALEWLEKHCPTALEPRIITAKLPKPEKTVTADGEVVWVSPCAGLEAKGEHDEMTVNGRYISALLKGRKDDEEGAL